MLRLPFALVLACSLLLLPLTPAAHGQFEDSAPRLDLKNEFGDFGGDLLGGSRTSDPLTVESFIVPAKDERPAMLVIRAKMAAGWHVYSLTQKEGGPPKTEITLDKSNAFKLTGGFHPQEPPKVSEKPEAWPDLPIEEHYDEVTWVAPIQFSKGVDPETLTIKGELSDGQVCNDEQGCVQFGFALEPKFTAKLGTPEQIASVKFQPRRKADDVGHYDDAKNHLVIRGYVEPQVVAPGDTAKLHISVQTDPGWHIYERKDEVGTERPTLLPLTTTSGLPASKPTVNNEVIEKDGVRYHEGKTTWTIELLIPKDSAAGRYDVEGYLAYLSCSDTTCLQPSAVKFATAVEVGSESVVGSRPVDFTKSSYGLAIQALDTQIAWANGADASSSDKPLIDYQAISDEQRAKRAYSIPVALGMALAAGFILNFMPCVLPVIGLKVMSFVQQAGEDRGRAFLLNAVYALGILSVFWVLATLAVFAGFSWGVTQFQSVEFNVVLASVVFIFALSFLGVWEIPIPGFVGSGKAVNAAEREGLSGAFAKGVLTTLLATPCTGPLLAPAVLWASEQPPYLTYTVFTFVGLGMALPYVVIGAQPQLLRFLPKPGAWMETFKNIMGFVLMATVIFILSYIPSQYVVPTVALMIGLWAACWWVGREQMTGANAQQMAVAWAGAGFFTLVVGLVSYLWLSGIMESRLEATINKRVNAALKETMQNQETDDPTLVSRGDSPRQSEYELPWEELSQEVLETHVANNRTVLVDFTADWCLVCKTNENTALNTKEMSELVKENNVVTLKGDLTNDSPEAEKMLQQLGYSAGGLPVYAIFPAGKPTEPILFTGLRSQAYFLEKVREAGPSQSSTDNRTAMRPAAQ